MPVTGLAKRLKQAREKHYDTPYRAAEGTSLSARTVYKVETGELSNPGAELIVRLCKRYGCSADWLLGLSSRRR